MTTAPVPKAEVLIYFDICGVFCIMSGTCWVLTNYLLLAKLFKNIITAIFTYVSFHSQGFSLLGLLLHIVVYIMKSSK